MSWGVGGGGGGGADYDCAVVRASFPVIVMSRMRFYRKLVCFSDRDGPRGGGAAGRGGYYPHVSDSSEWRLVSCNNV